jgi:Domain of unknown function (DUF4160)
MFFGIVIYTYFFDDETHKTPHIHARYQGKEASLSIADASVLAGSLPGSKLRLVQAWIDSPRRVGGRLGVGSERPTAVRDRSVAIVKEH